MTLDDLNKVAGIVESIAVVASVIYVAIQIKKNTTAVKSSTYQNIVSGVAGMEARLSDDAELARIFRIGSENDDELNPDERVRFHEFISSFFNFYENLYYQYQKGLIEEEMWKGWEENLRVYMKKPGFKAWWDVWGHVFSKSFGACVEAIQKSEIHSKTDKHQPNGRA
jgi:hypothetical protein